MGKTNSKKKNQQEIQEKDQFRRLISDEEIVTDFSPRCPVCGRKMVWGSDFMLSECGYIDDTTMMSEEELAEKTDQNGCIIDDRVVHSFYCNHCDCSQDWEDLEEGGALGLLSTVTVPDPDDDRENIIKYSEYAKQKYGMEDYNTEEPDGEAQKEN